FVTLPTRKRCAGVSASFVSRFASPAAPSQPLATTTAPGRPVATTASSSVSRLAAGNCRDEPNLVVGADRHINSVHLLAVDVDVHERAKRSALVEEQVGDRQALQRLAHVRSVRLEPPLTARLAPEEGGEQDYC